MIQEVQYMIMKIALLAICFIGLFFSLTALRIAKKSKRISKRPTYSKEVNRAVLESGIYIEHGMTHATNDKSIRPEHKLSNSFYESLH